MPNKGLPPVTVFDSDPFGPTVQAVRTLFFRIDSFVSFADLFLLCRPPPSSRPSKTSSLSSSPGSFLIRRLSTEARFVESYRSFAFAEELIASLILVVQPASFLSHYIGHEGPGSILSYLKKKGWVNSLSAGPSEGATGWGFLRISCDLTPEGLGSSISSSPLLGSSLTFPPFLYIHRELRTNLNRHLLLPRPPRQIRSSTRRVRGSSISRHPQLPVRREVFLPLRLRLGPRFSAVWTLAEGVDPQSALVDARIRRGEGEGDARVLDGREVQVDGG